MPRAKNPLRTQSRRPILGALLSPSFHGRNSLPEPFFFANGSDHDDDDDDDDDHDDDDAAAAADGDHANADDGQLSNQGQDPIW